jgi:lysophospholipase L1-like esterase
MSIARSLRRIAALAGAVLWVSGPVRGGEALPPNARLAIIGDSITEQRLYSQFVEAYLVACAGRPDLNVFQFGWSGETAGEFLSRLTNDLILFQPTVATTCYGMNDGEYGPYTDAIGLAYETNMRGVVTGLQNLGVQTIVIGTPGAVDSTYFRYGTTPDIYNQNLGELAAIDQRLAAELGQPFAELHALMSNTMVRAKATLGEGYDVCGTDGVHPGPNGHLIMAYAFLQALGCNGRIGDLTLDMAGPPTVSAGHRVLSSSPGRAEIESTRYPFCFEGDTNSSAGTRSITPFLPFNPALNRLLLRVSNLGTERANVTWGGQTKEFSRAQLGTGVNLAAEFWPTPFAAQFRRVLDAVTAKQYFETILVKRFITALRGCPNGAAGASPPASASSVVAQRMMAQQAELEAAAHRAVVPVKHTLRVTPLP